MQQESERKLRDLLGEATVADGADDEVLVVKSSPYVRVRVLVFQRRQPQALLHDDPLVLEGGRLLDVLHMS